MTTAPELLVADDDGVFREQLCRRLTAAGFAVCACDSAAQVSARLTNPASLAGAVLDMRLGDDNGLALIEAVRAHSATAPIIMLTGYGSIPTAVEATRRGATDYLLKPVEMSRLIALLRGEASGQPLEAVPEAPPSLARLEWDHIQQVLLENQGNVSATARQLGIDRRTLQRKLNKRPPARDYDRDRH